MAPPKKANKGVLKGKPTMPAPLSPLSAYIEVEPTDEEIRSAERLRRINAVNHKGLSPAANAVPLYLQPRGAFVIFAAVHLLAAIYAPIQDCDEVFNYYEPTHYLTHRYGLQTWEYSPEFAIRSWAYVGIHAIIMTVARLVPFVHTKIFQFYFLRAMLGAFCAFCEARLYDKISRTLSPRVGLLFVLIMVTSPGMFHASISFLPSSFAMYTTMLGVAAFMDWRGGVRTAQAIWAMGTGASLGWPFAGALIIPFMFEEFLLADLSGQLVEFLRRTLDGSTLR